MVSNQPLAGDTPGGASSTVVERADGVAWDDAADVVGGGGGGFGGAGGTAALEARAHGAVVLAIDGFISETNTYGCAAKTISHEHQTPSDLREYATSRVGESHGIDS